ncbi:SusC/RagA family TonB-linked outer membrane protein [Cytophagaceae bacterium DM2B3-1]|uniref:SusC/RagA family TonB-linked outer membrane protein n=1 Tax=Xanthocytophaga flava TaxID=3048013 RepID=A0ABT7CDV6_9BACT|nr:SusC/RagA family TonB-linked outer membrane protein [Xanthocytophaga flavus]MDJ1491881.1 SusC/RagA family TonB-linked outer membrane protein [Xanthocytophaga flavus]
MKNNRYHLFLGTVLLSGSVYLSGFAQSLAAVQIPRPTLEKSEPAAQSLIQVLGELENKYDVHFTYKNTVLENKTVKAFSSSSHELGKILDQLLTPQGLKYKRIDNIYVIYAPEEKVNFKLIKHISRESEHDNAIVSNQINTIALPKAEKLQNLLNAQEITVSGKVSGESGDAMPGVSVSIKGTTKGTTTNGEGRYTLGGVPENGVLVFSSIGYTTEEMQVSNRTIIDVQLKPDLQALSEVVVVGYGTQKKTSVTGAISSVSSKEIAALPVPSVEQAIQGRVAGAIVTNNGAPGEAPLVRIRGISSINFASNPLYVVDGIIGVDNFNNFDSKDIESVEVLKDANSAAIYGSRAAAGVVLITTKKGTRDGNIHVKLDSYIGVQKAWNKLDLLNRDQYLQYGTALLSNAGAALPPRFSAMNDPIYAGASQTFAQTDTDWQDALFQTATITQNNLSVSGGNEKSRFYSSAGYFSQAGIMKGTGYDRYNFRINSDHQVLKGISFGQTLLVSYGYQRKEQNAGGRTQVQNMIRMTPYIPLYNPTNIGGYGGNTGADGSDPQNPVRAALQDLDQVTSVRVLGSLFLDVSLTSWLKYRFNVGVNYQTSREYIYQPIYSEGFNSRTLAVLNDNRNNSFSPIYTNQLTFEKTIGEHSINALGVIEYQTGRSVSLNATGKASSNEIKEFDGLSNQSFTALRDERAIYSYIGRLNYEYANKYILSASIRRDGASQFAPGNKFGSFPSIGLGWRISEENFMKNIPFISELKVRGSYGSLGYIPGNYLWQTTVSSNTGADLGNVSTQGSFYDKLANKDLEWEITKMTNIGIDAGLLNNRITFSAEYYVRNTDNLILEVTPAVSTGYSNPTSANVGKMKNWGYEFQGSYNQSQGEFKWNISANIGVAKNEVKALDTPTSVLDRGALQDYGNTSITRTEAGHPVQSFYGWVTDGIFQNTAEIIGSDNKPSAPVQSLPLNNDGTVNLTEYNKADNKSKYTRPGDIRFKDINQDGQITDADRTYLGSFLPKFTYGLNFSANYKGFDLSMFFQGVQGNKIYNGTRVLTEGMIRLFNSSTTVLNAWTPENTNTDIPRAVNGDPNSNNRTSDRFIENGSYLRLKSLNIGYTLPADVLKSITKGNLNNFRIYISSQNLLTFTKYKGYDPEVGSRLNVNNGSLVQGIDYGQFPQARTLIIGLQAGF